LFVIIIFCALFPAVVAAEEEPEITIPAFEVPVAIVPTFILFLLMVIFWAWLPMYIPKPLKAVPVAVILKLSMVKYFVPKNEIIGDAELWIVLPFPFKVMLFIGEVPAIFPKVSVSL